MSRTFHARNAADGTKITRKRKTAAQLRNAAGVSGRRLTTRRAIVAAATDGRL